MDKKQKVYRSVFEGPGPFYEMYSTTFLLDTITTNSHQKGILRLRKNALN